MKWSDIAKSVVYTVGVFGGMFAVGYLGGIAAYTVGYKDGSEHTVGLISGFFKDAISNKEEETE